MPYSDPEKRRAYRKVYFAKWYKQNKTKFKKQVAACNKRRHKEIKDWLDTIKLEQGCSNCGYKKHAAALEFHHLEDKFRAVSQLRLNHSKIKIIAEIEKCQLLCANCHREATHS